MIPLQLIAGIIATLLVCLFPQRLLFQQMIYSLVFWQVFQIGFGFIITIRAKTTPSAFVGIIMLTEAVLGPLWAWMFANENPPFLVNLVERIIIYTVFSPVTFKVRKGK